MATRRKVVPEGWIVRAGSSMHGRPSGGARSREALPLGHATAGIGRGVGPPGHPRHHARLAAFQLKPRSERAAPRVCRIGIHFLPKGILFIADELLTESGGRATH